MLRFLRSPVELKAGPHGHLAHVEFAVNELVAEGDQLRAKQTEGRETIDAGLLFRAVGYRGKPLPDVPFDEQRAVIANDQGRVIGTDGTHAPGEYVVGWIKRGPSGVIGTNKKDAQETVDRLLEDFSGEPPHTPADPTPEGAERLLVTRRPDLVTYAGWEAIDRHERSLGESQGRPRVKLTQIEELVRAAGAEQA